MDRPWVIVLNSGSMPGLVATAAAAEKPFLAGLYVHEGRPADTWYHQSFLSQVERFSVRRPLELDLPQLSVRPERAASLALRWPQLLMAAAAAALEIKAERLVWPVQVGEDSDAIARVTQLVLLVQQTVEVEAGRDLRIDTPLVELTDKQLVEMGHQMDLPWELSRSCVSDTAQPCGSCGGCLERRKAFAQAGIADPGQLVAIPQ